MNWTDKSGQTAIARKKAPLPTRIIIEKGDVHGKVVNWGCGNDTFTKDLCLKLPYVTRVLEYDPNIVGKDTCYGFGFNDVFIVNYVLNVLPPEERKDVLRYLRIFGDFDAKYYFAVRGNTAPVPTWKKHKDGWITGTGTFQKLYTEAQLLKELRQSWNYAKLVESRDSMIIAVASNLPILP